MRNLLILILSFCFFSCAFSGEEKLILSTPEYFSNTKINQWQIVSFDSNMTPISFSVSSKESFSLSVCKNICTPILAFPENNYNKPLGFLYPYSNNFSTAGGFASSVLNTLYLGSFTENNVSQISIYLSSFNWQKFLELCFLCPDPWKLDKQKIVTQIASRSFSINTFSDELN